MMYKNVNLSKNVLFTGGWYEEKLLDITRDKIRMNIIMSRQR